MLKIGYAGTLRSYKKLSKKDKPNLGLLKKWLWTYQVNNIISSTRSERYIFNALEELKQYKPEYYQKLNVWFWGLIDKEIENEAQKRDISDIVSVDGYVSKIESENRLNECDLLFLPLEVSTNDQNTFYLPGKLFDYLEIGKPVLVIGEESDATNILKKSGLGIVCSPFNTAKIVETLIYLIDNQESLSKQYSPNREYISKFCFSNLTKELALLLDELD